MLEKYGQKYEKIDEKEKGKQILNHDERSIIASIASQRRLTQKFNLAVMNLPKTEYTEALKRTAEGHLQVVQSEAAGHNLEIRKESPDNLLDKSALVAKQFPGLAALCAAHAAKKQQLQKESFDQSLTEARELLSQINPESQNYPTNLLPEAIVIGINTRQIKGKTLPDMAKIAKAITTDFSLLKDYALVLDENNRKQFLSFISDENKRREVGQLMDTSVSEVLHQSVVAEKTAEAAQRKAIRLRLYQELQNELVKDKIENKQITRVLAEAVSGLGKDTQQLLLEIIRDEYENKTPEKNINRHLPRVIKIFLDQFEDWKGNDIVLQLIGDKNLNPHLAVYLMKRLTKNGYLPEDVLKWWNTSRAQFGRGKESETKRLAVIQSIIGDLGVMPSRDILDFVADDKQWKNAPLAERIKEIQSSQTEFAKYKDNRDLVRYLHRDGKKAMIYYLLHGGDDRFNLINNYSLDKFKEMLGLISDLEIHEDPLEKFQDSLIDSGLKDEQVKNIIERLKGGHYPLADESRAVHEISFAVSDNSKIINANHELADILGKNQLGVILAYPLYREFLVDKKDDKQAAELLSKMSTAQTFLDRSQLINEIEQQYPELKAQAIATLLENWRSFGEKMVLELSLEQVFGEGQIKVQGQELLPRLDAKRIDLKKIKKDLLVLLKGGHQKKESINKQLHQKNKAIKGLLAGFEKLTDDSKKSELQKKIDSIKKEVATLEKEREIISNQPATKRFAHLSKEEKKDEIDRLGKEIIALTEKSPSAIFTYLTMQVLGEDKLLESDISLIKEMESHLQSPFQNISDVLTYKQPIQFESTKNQSIRLEYLDKTKRLMNMVRFADSKICCFSSNNYEQVISHDTPNKYWVASINADPLSFVISLESPHSNPVESNRAEPVENLGFIFGSYGVTEENKPAVLLNGVYYAPGIGSKEQMERIVSGVEKIFSGLPINTITIAQMYGGSVGEDKMPDNWNNNGIELNRLRALDDDQGDPEDKIYDDLGTGSDLNQSHYYGDHVWYKKIK